MEKINTYEPEIVKQQALNVDFGEDDFEDIKKDGLIKTRLNENVIIQRIAKDLYKNSTSGFRELYNNAARACRIANKEYNSNEAFVRVTIDKANRQLIIEDIHATGISIKRFKEVLLVLGTSDNLDSHEVGQFGMGFASYTTLTSAMILETKSRIKGNNGEYQNYKMIAKDGMSFQPIGKSSLQYFGTRLTMTLYENINEQELIQLFKKLVRFSGIKSVLSLRNFDEDEETIFEADTVFNTIREKIGHKGTITFTNNDFEFIAVIKKPYADIGREVLVLGVPIESTLDFPFVNWVLNIKNERLYKPMPDRERLTDKADNELQVIIDDLFIQFFKKIKINNYTELKVSSFKDSFLWLVGNSFQKYMPVHLETLSNKLDFHVKEAGGGKNKSLHLISRVLQDYENIVYMKNNTNRSVEKIESLYDNVFCFTVMRTGRWKEELAFIQKFGVEDSSTIFKRNRIKIIKDVKELQDIEIIAHGNDGEYNYKKDIITVKEIDESIMMVDDGTTNKIISIIRNIYCPFRVTKYFKQLENTDVQILSEYKATLPKMVVSTNRGDMMLEEAGKNDTHLCLDYQENFKDIVSKSKKLIMIDREQFFAYTLYQADYNKIYDISRTNLSSILESVIGVNLPNDDKLNFFNEHYQSISECHWKIFARFLYNTSEFDSTQDVEVDKILKYVKGLAKFDHTSIYQSIVFYYSLKGNTKVKNYSADELLREEWNVVQKNVNTFDKSLRKLILPEIFNDFTVSYLKSNVCRYYSSTHRDNAFITLKTTDEKVLLKTNFKIFGCSVSISIRKIIRDGDSTIVSMKLMIK